MDAAIRDAERAAAAGDPLEAERLAGLRARTVVVPPPRRGKAAERAEVERLARLEDAATKALDEAKYQYRIRCEILHDRVKEFLAARRARRPSTAALEGMSYQCEETTTYEVQVAAARTERERTYHAWHRAALGTCPIRVRRPGDLLDRRCEGQLGPDGRCTVCPDACECPGCSGAL